MIDRTIVNKCLTAIDGKSSLERLLNGRERMNPPSPKEKIGSTAAAKTVGKLGNPKSDSLIEKPKKQLGVEDKKKLPKTRKKIA